MLHRFSKLAVLIVALPLLSACAEHWGKPGGTPMQFSAVKSTCNAQAAAQFPPAIRPVEWEPGYRTPVVTQCTHSPGTSTCAQSGGDYVPPEIVNLDDNEDARDEAVRACLYQNGWQPVD